MVRQLGHWASCHIHESPNLGFAWSFSQIVKQEPACNYQGEEKHTNSSRSLCGQINLLASPMEQTSPLQLPSRHVCSDSVAFNATKRKDGHNDSTGVIADDMEDEFQNWLQN